MRGGKLALLGAGLFILFALLGIVGFSADEIPFGVKAKEIFASGAIDVSDSPTFGFVPGGWFSGGGRLTDGYEFKTGNRIGVTLDGIEYSLRMWNVGKMGGVEGMLFWKKEYEKAYLTLSYSPDNPGHLVGDRVDNSKLKMPDGWKIENVTGLPTVAPVSCAMNFSGGPTGKFSGICSNGATISGRVVAGHSALFEQIEGNIGEKTKHYALDFIKGKELVLGSGFDDWKFDDSTLEDSGTRFNSLSGSVQVRHDKDSRWGFGWLNTVLYVDDHVKTGEESSAILSFADMSTFLMKEETEIIVNSPPKRDSKWALVSGKIRANIRKMMKDGTMEIEMSQAVAGIKGTTLVLEEDGRNSTLKVLEGTVEFRAKSGGAPVLVSAGEAVSATSSGLGKKGTFDVSAEEKSWEKIEGSGLKIPGFVLGLVGTILFGGLVLGGIYFLGKKKGKNKEKGHKGK